MKRRKTRMALLTKATREKWFEFLGLGEYNKKNVLKFQKMAFTDEDEHDGEWGPHTDNAFRHWHHVKLYTENFEPEEFKCPCGHCTGYPTWMRAKELKHIQTIRTHFGKPVIITSGLRCKYENNRVGGDPESRHLKGYAVDFAIHGLTGDLDGRKKVIKYAKKLKNHNYSYCNGFDSKGKARVAPGMGDAVHTDTK